MTPLRYALMNNASGVVELLLKAHATIPTEALGPRSMEIEKLLDRYAAAKTNAPAQNAVK